MSNLVETMNEDLAIHQKMDDEPNDVGGLSAEELKAKFDQAGLALQAYLNEKLVPGHNALSQTVDGLADELRHHTDYDPAGLTAQNIGLLRELADRYGLTDKLAPTVHDALEVLVDAGQYLDHWWVRRPGLNASSTVWLGEVVSVPSPSSDAGRHYAFARSVYNKGYPDVTVTYADEVEPDADGTLHLKSPQTITTSPKTFEANVPMEVLRGKYVQAWDDPGHIMRVCENADLLKYGGSMGNTLQPYYFAASEVQEVFCSIGDRAWERLHRADRDAYPDSGELNDMEYRYMGVPLARLVDMMVAEVTAE